MLPSSQTSPPSRIPSPHTGLVQLSRQVEGVSNVLSVAVLSSTSVVGALSTKLQPSTPSRKLGVMSIGKVSDQQRAELKLPEGQGLRIGRVVSDSRAAQGGLKGGDILVEMDGKPVPATAAEFSTFLGGLKDPEKERTIDIVVIRKGMKETLRGVELPRARRN